MKTVVFLIGFLAVSYGVFVVFASGAAAEATVWILVGVLLQLAGGTASKQGQRGSLENPLVVLANSLRAVRRRVQNWDRRA
jgi:hypothetical protein